MTQHSHRPSSSLKQRNKPFKKGSAAPVSASAYREAQKRREAAPGITASLRPINKQQRALETKQKRSRQLQHLQQLKLSLRGAAACGHAALPPRVVLIVSFDERTDSRVVFAALARQLRQDLALQDTHSSARYNPADPQSDLTTALVSSFCRAGPASSPLNAEAHTSDPSVSSSTFLFPLPGYARCPTLPLRSQQRVLLLPAPSPKNLLPLLDLCKCADLLLCVFSGECTYTRPAFDEHGYRFLTALKLQGVPPVVGVGSPTALQTQMDFLSGPTSSSPFAAGSNDTSTTSEAMDTSDASSMSLDTLHPKSGGGKAGKKQAAESLRFQQRYFTSEFGSDKKFCAVALPSDWQKVVRTIGGANVPQDVASSSPAAASLMNAGADLQWRRGRGYMLALDWDILTRAQLQAQMGGEPSTAEQQTQEGSEDDEAEETFLQAYGFVRGVGMTCRLPIHITGVGDFIAERIEAVYEHDLRRDKRKVSAAAANGVGCQFAPRQEDCEMQAGDASGGHGMNADPSENGSGDSSALHRLDEESLTPAERAELLASMRPLQPFDSTTLEQTWPTEAELQEAAETKEKKKGGKCRRIRVPKGISEYERIWYEEEVDEDEAEDHAERDEEEEEAVEMGSDDEKDDDEWQTEEIAEHPSDAGDMQKEKEEQAKKRNFTIEQRAAEDLQFPDEVDTPLDVEARVRFQKYRGLKSFRTSFWNKDEDLPVAYARVVDFERFKAMSAFARGELRRLCSSNAFHGRFCRVTIPLHFHPAMEQLSGNGGIIQRRTDKGFLILSSLLPYECAVSVVHMQLTRGGTFEGPVKGKDELLFNCGFRRFVGRPVYSVDRGISNTGSHMDKAKMLPFFRFGTSCVASLYAPTLYPPASVVVFRRTEDSAQPLQVCAWGSVLNSSSNRLIIKRIVLTGYPFKVHRRKAVVRFMFFNPRDIRWFAPVELHTKKGLRGNIMQPLGTHGYMKCKFNQYVKQDDTVCMYLYKRVFPKWHPPTWGGNPALLPTDEIQKANDDRDMEMPFKQWYFATFHGISYSQYLCAVRAVQ
ncbi:putative ribosome biogenesis protein [Besnoitia besnoiti]|uniref:Putative ribosome biogenesis protein n=1 Tax=Besnoitia besnoiti TaxID=94643 RepID=A0A2A9MFF0_BESBE|nr:putative ribosome biogenesis protein [Besnoitia besnoiti]PFH36649.1 putative ribosome biogenesis protein [Besnoitia besnoiti]